LKLEDAVVDGEEAEQENEAEVLEEIDSVRAAS